MFFITQAVWTVSHGVSLSALIAANPHITNPNLIFPGDVLCVPPMVPPPPPPPPKKECPCPVTLKDFINRQVEVTTVCGVVTGMLSFVADTSITLADPKTFRIAVVLCRRSVSCGFSGTTRGSRQCAAIAGDRADRGSVREGVLCQDDGIALLGAPENPGPSPFGEGPLC
ncbi:MAG: LysM peptidoglycan-binding domain-containing protein [Bacillota bacterium]|nr:LysM peptidoglycan-binding domain-containing protein [Bacillota bacterium]